MSEKREGFNRHAAQIANSLRRMADEIEYNAKRNDEADDIAQTIIDTCTWGFANLRLGLLVRWAGRVMRDDSDTN